LHKRYSAGGADSIVVIGTCSLGDIVVCPLSTFVALGQGINLSLSSQSQRHLASTEGCFGSCCAAVRGLLDAKPAATAGNFSSDKASCAKEVVWRSSFCPLLLLRRASCCCCTYLAHVCLCLQT
ncbi:unnamed protein product, partial [Ectocarpus fasciculatus]